MKQNQLLAEMHGEITITELSREEQNTFYLSMLFRIIELCKSDERG